MTQPATPSPRSSTSPFACETLQNVPRPTFSAIFALALLAGLSFWWCKGFTKDADIASVSKLEGSLVSFLETERQREHHPSILIAGSSVNGLGVYRALLEERLGQLAGKVALGGGGIWECERILKKYQTETQNTKIVYVDLRVFCGGSAIGGQIANAFRIWHDFSDDRDVRLYKSLRSRGVIPAMLDGVEFSIFSGVCRYRQSFRGLRHVWKNYLKPRVADNEQTSEQVVLSDFETMWAEADRIEMHKVIQDELAHYTSDATYTPQNSYTQGCIKGCRLACTQHSTEAESWLWDFVRYCEGRGIFVVFNVPPCWRTLPPLPDQNDPNLTIDQKKYLALFDKLNAQPNCRVIVLKDFQTLIPDAVDAEYLFDTHHMTKNGATVYTHWLADQTLRDEKICAHLGIPCQPDAKTDFIKLVAELGMTVPQSETQSSETRVAEIGATVK